MMDNLGANKSHTPCLSWTGQNGWSTTSSQGSLFNTLPSSQHLSLGSSSNQRSSFDHLQASNPGCMSGIGTAPSTHHSALYKASHVSSSSPAATLFANSVIPSSSQIISFANQGKNAPPQSLPQTNQAAQPFRSQHAPLVSSHDPYKASFQLPLTDQASQNLPSCGQRASTAQASFEEAYLEFAGVSGYTQGQAASTSQEQRPWSSSAAAQPDKASSQQGSISLPVNSERRRSVLLHQRAQLLQHLAELDKLLESVPPEDSGNRQAPHTQSQSRFSDQNETCEAAEDPMSESESVKLENASVKTENDNDPDYFPDNDDDFSDGQPDSDGGSPSHSRPGTPTDEKPSSPQKTQDEESSSSSESVAATPPAKTCASKKRKTPEAEVLPTLNEGQRRVYDRRNYCVFCSKSMGKMARHFEMIHSDKAEVAAAFQYPKGSRERQKIWNRLINQGNFAHNKLVLKTGKGHLVVRKRQQKPERAQDFLHCLHCRGLYRKKALTRHMRLCPERVKNSDEPEIGKKRVGLQCVLEISDDLDITDGFKGVLSQMTYDDVTKTIMEDSVIIQLGELLFTQQGSDPKKYDYIRQKLRHIARLVLEAQKRTPLEKLEDFFLPSNFPHVVSAVKVLAGYDPEKKTYRVPSLAIKLGYLLQKACNIVEDNAVKSGDASLAESARKFLSVYRKKWNKRISGGALTTLRETKLKTAKKVPFAQDVKRLNFHMEKVHSLAEKKLRESPSPENYAALSRVILARTAVFNRRTISEISSMKLTAFLSRKKSNPHSPVDIYGTDMERTMCRFFTRIEIRGKCGRMVPVLLKPSLESAMELFVKARETCGVPSKNPFLFARPHALTSYGGSDCILKLVKDCGAKDPKILRWAKIRKHYTTMLQLINLDEHEANQIFGPNNQVRNLREDSSMHLDDTEMDCSELFQPERGRRTASWDEDEDEDEDLDTCYEAAQSVTKRRKSAKSNKKGVQKQGKQKWEEEEVLAVERHLMRLIQEHKVPQKYDCIQCLEAEPEALRTRSWRGVKDYVRNRITALKRQGGSSRASL